MIRLPASFLAGGAALTAMLILFLLWRVEVGHNGRLSGQLETTRADLSQCRKNGEKLETSLEAQNQAVEALRDEGAAQVAETSATLSRRDIDRAVAQARAQWLLERPIAGETECARLIDVVDSARARP